MASNDGTRKAKEYSSKYTLLLSVGDSLDCNLHAAVDRFCFAAEIIGLLR